MAGLKERPNLLRAFVEAGELSTEDYAHLVEQAREKARPPEHIGIEAGLVSEERVVAHLVRLTGFQPWNPVHEPPDWEVAKGLTASFINSHLALPIRRSGTTTIVAVADPFSEVCHAGLAFALGNEISFRIGAATDIRAALNAHRFSVTADGQNDIRPPAGTQSVAQLLQDLVARACDQSASDIHVETQERLTNVRFRVDGVLSEPMTLDVGLGAATIARAKVLSELNVADSRLPQDGRFSLAVRGKPLDIRVATTPTIVGESMTLRILNRPGSARALDALNLGDKETTLLRSAFARRAGLLLVAGPTGSGKTTTLYAGLQLLKDKGLKVVSIEDPVEFKLDHVTQIQVAPEIGLSFSSALRSLLRHDPDAILVGEIRDPETASIAVQAALTGHLVVASVHAQDAVRAVSRLLDMGVERYHLSAALAGTLAQRLTRRLCEGCCTEVQPTSSQLDLIARLGFFAPSSGRWFGAPGCTRCGGRGYNGRFAVAESVDASHTFNEAMGRGDSIVVLRQIAESEGYRPLAFDALAKAGAGMTSLEEALLLVGDL